MRHIARARIATREKQQVVHELCHAVGFGHHFVESRAIRFGSAELPGGQLGRGANDSQGCAKFMRSVRRELRQAIDRGFQPGENSVPGLRKTLQFVPGLRYRQAPGEIVDTDGLGGVDDGCHRLQGAAAQPVSARCGDQNHDRRAGEQQVAQLLQRFVDWFQRAGDGDLIRLAVDENAFEVGMLMPEGLPYRSKEK